MLFGEGELTMKKLENYTLYELHQLHPDDISVETLGFTAGDWARRIAVLETAGTPCEGCKHVVFRVPLACMYPCNSCCRAGRDQYEPEDGAAVSKPAKAVEPGRKALTVADLDPMFPFYSVMLDQDTKIGSKRSGRVAGGGYEFDGYYKSEYTRTGVDKYLPYDQRKYKSTPPWLKYKVVEVVNTRHGLSIIAKGPD